MSIRLPWNKIAIICAIGLFGSVLISWPVQAKMYKWKDDKGKTHYTDSVSKIPAKYRKGNQRNFKTMRSAPANSSGAGGGSSSSGSGFTIAIPKKGAAVPLIPMGNGNHAVDVTINGRAKLRLMLDTGASMVVLHPSVASQLGIRNIDDQPKIVVSTAGGKELNAIGVLDSVKVGQAVVPNVEATFNSHMDPAGGLLGMTFLNDFRFEIDRQQNLLILKPLREGAGGSYGDRPLTWWTEKYKNYFTGLNRASYYKTKTKVRKEIVEQQRMATYYQDLIDRLDRRANSANLPKQFRDPFGNRGK